ncbi:hypothetical protein PV10_07352 [Exophiala mesophila]|uniref:Uncharacterized protein n=1 Tax=Exophiala mesophila TaxID=212818 RepID=A0A0D1Z5E8_EXOME|nr:uncharacterized protein PV10_07352 [Exophiala mesophila]KIV90002.1 hypothetical protein PV10_07352 [Exophiala mesophila]
MPGSALRDHHHQDQNQNHVYPCLAEGFRTCVYPATLVLKVERAFLAEQGKAENVDRQDKSLLLPLEGNQVDNRPHLPDITGTKRHCLTLILSDGHLQVYGLLESSLLTTNLLGLLPGDIVRIKKFQVRTAPRLSGQGKVVYLGVSSCEWIDGPPRRASLAGDNTGGGFIVEDEEEAQNDDTESKHVEVSTLEENPKGLPSIVDTLEDLEAGGFLREEDDLPLSLDNNPPTQNIQLTSIPIRSPTSHKRPIMEETSQFRRARKKHKTGTRSESQIAPSTATQTSPAPKNHSSGAGPDSDDDDDFFETVVVSPSTIKKRQESLRRQEFTSAVDKTPVRFRETPDIQSNQLLPSSSLPPVTPSRSTAMLPNNTTITTDFDDEDIGGDPGPSSCPPSTLDILFEDTADQGELEHPTTSTSQAQPPIPPTQVPPSTTTNLTHPTTEPPPSSTPFHPLSTLLPLTIPRRNYSCTVLGLITWVSASLIYKSNSGFPPKRNIRIHDLSITSQRAVFTVAVFVDPKQFLPKVGTVALFRGLTMNRSGVDVILNAYKGLKDWEGLEGEKWFVDDEEGLVELGYGDRVKELKAWWEERRKGL